MNAQRILDQATAQGQSALSEAQSKRILEEYGVPVVRETVVSTPEEACQAANDSGYPVVLKALGAKLTHKSERGLVRLNLASENAVAEAAEALAGIAGDDLEGFLVQPQIQGRREFVAGFFRDPTFGPVVMFGLGGVLTEALDDVTFRLAPLEAKDVRRMVEEVQGRKLLGAFRGENAVNMEQLEAALTGLSRLAIEHPEVAEADINPLIAGSDGALCAVDALLVLGASEEPEHSRYKLDPRRLGPMFYPHSVAFIGASGTIGKWGHILPTNVLAGGFEGEIYLVNPKGGTMIGREVYTSLEDVPGKIDLAVVTVPGKYVFDLLPQCAAKGIKSMVLVASGFSETGAEGRKLEEDLVREARKHDVLILGPNTMGICNPHDRFFCTASHIWPRKGSTVLVSQSGNMGNQLLAFAEQEDIGIRAFSGSGNEAMITIEDYMEAFEVDEFTKTVVLYLESVKDGRRFFKAARRVGRTKPVVVLKGGRTDEGSQAAASHTGALAGNNRVFNAVCKQAGIVMVPNPMNLLDVSAAFSCLPLPKGPRIGIVTLGGGWGVVATDLCSEHGLEVPELAPELIEKFDKMLPFFWSRANPVDLVGQTDFVLPMTVTEELAKWDGCDAIINLGIVGTKAYLDQYGKSINKVDPTYPPEFIEASSSQLKEFERKYLAYTVELMETYHKPIVGVSLLADEDSRTVYRFEDRAYDGVFFLTPERAVKALAGMWQYVRWLEHENGEG